MSNSETQFDPETLQARWVLGGLNAEGLVDQAVLALKHGFSGSALQQLAGLVSATKRDLGNLPARAFVEMGLDPVGKEQAIALLISRSEPKTCNTITALLEAFPDFLGRWKEHVAWWGGMPAGCYNDMAKFVEFVIDDLYEKENLSETRRAFALLNQLYIDGDEEAQGLIATGFLEGVQSVASWRPYGNRVFEQFLPPASMKVWKGLQHLWAGKSSLADVIRAERNRREE
jgi:hypothetical protein